MLCKCLTAYRRTAGASDRQRVILIGAQAFVDIFLSPSRHRRIIVAFHMNRSAIKLVNCFQ
jgi:hypothetical protein